MDTLKYKCFATVIREGSLTAAGKKLGYTQSAVSQMMQAMESEFGFKLLIRAKSGVSLTPDGERIMPRIQAVLAADEALHESIAEVNGLRSGTVRIGVFQSVAEMWLPDIISEFNALYPNIKLDFWVNTYEPIEKWICEQTVDCGFITQSNQSAFDFIPLTKDRLLMVLPKDHPFARKRNFPLKQLANESFIIPSEGSNYSIGSILGEADISLNVQYALNDDYAAIALAEKGLGVTILPELILNNQHAKVAIKPLSPPCYRTIGIGVHSCTALSPACRRFISFVKDWLDEAHSY